MKYTFDVQWTETKRYKGEKHKADFLVENHVVSAGNRADAADIAQEEIRRYLGLPKSKINQVTVTYQGKSDD